jgi:hypothetical protein
MYKIIFLIPYFGKFPEWSDLFFETIKKNSTVDFYFFTDCDIEKYPAPNIEFLKISFQDYLKLVNKNKDLNFKPENAYKLCDLRPLYGNLHANIIEGYDFYGWTDLDILFGDIRSFYTDDILKHYDVFSTHEVRISGHFSLFRNTLKNKMMYKNIYKWQEALSKKEFVGIDEHGLTNAYLMTFFDKINEKFDLHIDNFITKYFSKIRRKRIFLKEQFTTPFTTIPWIDGSINSKQPSLWFYKNGSITNDRDTSRNFIYIHFMNFKNSQWRHDGTVAPWENLTSICSATVKDMANGIKIDHTGIKPI